LIKKIKQYPYRNLIFFISYNFKQIKIKTGIAGTPILKKTAQIIGNTIHNGSVYFLPIPADNSIFLDSTETISYGVNELINPIESRLNVLILKQNT